MANTGLFISFEGIDGAGKSTHIAGLAETFRNQGRQVTLTREPGGTALAEQLRDMVQAGKVAERVLACGALNTGTPSADASANTDS